MLGSGLDTWKLKGALGNAIMGFEGGSNQERYEAIRSTWRRPGVHGTKQGGLDFGTKQDRLETVKSA